MFAFETERFAGRIPGFADVDWIVQLIATAQPGIEPTSGEQVRRLVQTQEDGWGPGQEGRGRTRAWIVIERVDPGVGVALVTIDLAYRNRNPAIGFATKLWTAEPSLIVHRDWRFKGVGKEVMPAVTSSFGSEVEQVLARTLCPTRPDIAGDREALQQAIAAAAILTSAGFDQDGADDTGRIWWHLPSSTDHKMMRVRVDLGLLKTMHPLLATTTCAEYGYRAAIALQRRRHRPGASLAVNVKDEVVLSAVLEWKEIRAKGLRDGVRQLDSNQVTEDGAEAVALALLSVSKGWVIRRRLQRGEYADWLLRDPGDRDVALEVSGIDGAFDSHRMVEKLRQVAKVSERVPVRAACVVAFGPPTVDLETL